LTSIRSINRKEEAASTRVYCQNRRVGTSCDFCPDFNRRNKAVCQIRTRSKVSHKIVDNACACEECKEKFENNELPKCEKCGQLKTRMSFHYNCSENKEKELPVLPHEERVATRYERQINTLREEKVVAEEIIEEERAAHEDFMKELLDRIKELEVEVARLKKQTSQELEKEINELKSQLAQLQQQNNQLVAQIETPPKDKGIKNLFKFN
ncbi:689_t:CDS:2, partial [Scutellospora calospora]